LIIALKPFKDATGSINSFKRFLYRLGWGASSIPPSYMNLATKIGDAVTLAESLTDSPDISEIVQLFDKIKEIYHDIQNLSEAPPGVDSTEFLNEIKDRLFEILIVDYLITAQPFLYNFFQMVGVIKPVHFAGAGSRPSFIRYKLNWSEIPKIFTEPHKLPEKIYGWGSKDFKFELLAKHSLEIFSVIGAPVSYSIIDDESSYKYLGFNEYEAAPALVDKAINIPFTIINIDGKDQELGLAILKLPGIDGKLPGIVLQPSIPSEIGTTLRIREDIDFRLKAGSNIAAMFGILIRPDEISVEYPFKDGSLPDFGFGAGMDYKPSDALILLGSENNTRLEFNGFSFDFEFNFTDGDPEVELGALLNGLAIVIASNDSDSFISKILGDGNAKIDIPLGIEWSSIHGIRFKGGAGFEVSLHPHITLGPISIPELQLAIKAEIDNPPKIRLDVGVGIAGDLGPLQFVVQGIGMSLDMVIKDDGNAGPFDIDLGFKPPNGIGLSIDASAVKGGGYLYFDFDKEEYAGALELTVQDTISLKAIGILNTKMPDGSKGFSLFILVTAEFSPIQLGYGFTLLGVGGLLGLNRTVIVEKLRSGVKDNSIKSIMFPEDIIANIVRILSDIKQVFPPYQGHFIIGPMGKIGWGTPTIISLELGILIEVPDPLIAILGVLKSVLPEEKAPILKMQVNFLGLIDFEKKEISFDASLYDSKLLVFTLTGDMALRINWGKQS
ncbi:MAG TPA: DUF6603 domain-containing protein, partial [Bacteroidales bacterium]|nr:DUF6603 domain-containing protein [Bacteroidales bacterium]